MGRGQNMNDNTRRGLRTAFQALVGFLAAGGLNLIWSNFLSNHDNKIDPTLLFVVGLVLTGITGVAQNAFEDATGKGVLIPKDRAIGDRQMGTGVGDKQAKPT